MITKFDSSYVGTVDMENLGYLGTPINDRWYSNDELAGALHKAVAYAQKMDGLGYDTFWMAEHHFQPEGTECIPNLLMLAMHLVNQTKTLKIGCGFNVVPMWHPLRLAEDYAVADILTGGRVVMGIGRGYHSREVESFGAPVLDQAANQELFEEGFELMTKAWNEEAFAHRGKHYTVPPAIKYRGYDLAEVTLVPRPVRRPVEVWQPIASGKSIDFMARHRIKGMVTLNGERITEQVFHAYRDARAKHGDRLELGQDLCLGLGFYMARSRQEAIERVRPAHDERYKWFAPFGFVRYADAEGRPWGTPGAPARIPTIEDGVAQKAWMVGSPADCVALIREYEARYPGLEQLMLHWPEGVPPAEFQEQLRWFARDVMPSFVRR
jgi:alkanesulfonate monooxygenase SsuD/methylene tetrahydromethanopterin reductase-like flavin-dependent oxidoreductase (luciferase family)